MELQKVTNFLDITSDNKDLPKFVTKKWIKVYDHSQGNYDINKKIRTKTSMLRSDLCDFSHAYIFVTKKHLLLMILKHLIIQKILHMLLIMQVIMSLARKVGF